MHLERFSGLLAESWVVRPLDVCHAQTASQAMSNIHVTSTSQRGMSRELCNAPDDVSVHMQEPLTKESLICSQGRLETDLHVKGITAKFGGLCR